MKKTFISPCRILSAGFSNSFYPAIILLFLSLLPLVGICQDTKEVPPLKFPSYADSTYLIIEGSLSDPENVWKNIKVFVRAGDRLEGHLFVKDGLFTWDIEKGEDIKISENIFQHFLEDWKQSNEKLKTGRYEIRDLSGRKHAMLKDSCRVKRSRQLDSL